MIVTRHETGWPCHFIMGDRCAFHRGTVLSAGSVSIVVSTVGALRRSEVMSRVRAELQQPEPDCQYEEVGHQRHYETMAFHALRHSCGCWGADVQREVSFDAPWSMTHDEDRHDADAMHEAVVAEIIGKLERGQIGVPC